MPYGFTLIEMMIAIAIFSVAVALGIPSYRTWVQNSQIRNAAESIQNGIQRARGEAVKRNANVAFVMGVNSGWKVCVVDTTAADKCGEVVETRSGNEGSKNVTVSVTPSGPPPATTITFSNLGTVAPNADTSAALTQIDLTSSVTSADLRNLRVAIGVGGVGGNPRVCDPALGTSSTDPRRCY